MLNEVTLRVIMLNVVMLNVVMLNVVMLNVVMLNVIMLNVITTLCVTKLNKTAPGTQYCYAKCQLSIVSFMPSITNKHIMLSVVAPLK
jgi:hypothetical protein